MLAKDLYFRLITDLNSRNPVIRKKAMFALSAADDHRIVGPATRRLFDSDAEIRQAAAETLAKYAFAESAAAVLALFVEGECVRHTVIEQLGKLFLQAMPAPQHAVIAVTSASLTELYEDVAHVAASHSDVYVRRAAVEGLYQSNQETLAPAFILPALDDDPVVRKYAAVGMAENCVTALAHRLYHDADQRVAMESRRAFRREGMPTWVKDEHRRVMEKDVAFCLPKCGTVLFHDKGWKLQRKLATDWVRVGQSQNALAAAVFLDEVGLAPEHIRELAESNPQAGAARHFLERRSIIRSVDRQTAAPALILKSKRILVAGGDSHAQSIRQALTSLGADVEYFSGFNNEMSKRSPLRVDAVVLVWKEVSHSVAGHARTVAEKVGCSLLYAKTANAQAVVATVLDSMGL